MHNICFRDEILADPSYLGFGGGYGGYGLGKNFGYGYGFRHGYGGYGWGKGGIRLYGFGKRYHCY